MVERGQESAQDSELLRKDAIEKMEKINSK